MGEYRESLRKKFKEVGDMIREQAQEQSDHKEIMDMVIDNKNNFNDWNIKKEELWKYIV